MGEALAASFYVDVESRPADGVRLMWSLRNHTPFAVDSAWGRDMDGVHEWIVAVKATYDIRLDGNLVRSDEQLKPLLLPEFNGESGKSSLRYEEDLVAGKPTTDVLINGTAYAPKGRLSREFLIEARIDNMRKIIRVIGNRTWLGDPLGDRVSEIEPVTEVPIIYEHAYGGYDTTDPDPKNQRIDSRNPVGTGVTARRAHRLGKSLLNFEYPEGNPEKSGPAGFGAIASYWSPRRELQGTYNHIWEVTRCPLLPIDWNARSLLCSPADQRPATYLHGGESVELINLTRDGALRFTLPKAYFAFMTRISGRKEEHRGRLSTVIIEPDYPRIILVWVTALKCRTDVDYLEETVVLEKRYI